MADGLTIDFDVDYDFEQPFNMNLGAHLTVAKHFEIIVDVSLWDEVRGLSIGMGGRF